jgi:hypothetical protein
MILEAIFGIQQSAAPGFLWFDLCKSYNKNVPQVLSYAAKKKRNTGFVTGKGNI